MTEKFHSNDLPIGSRDLGMHYKSLPAVVQRGERELEHKPHFSCSIRIKSGQGRGAAATYIKASTSSAPAQVRQKEVAWTKRGKKSI